MPLFVTWMSFSIYFSSLDTVVHLQRPCTLVRVQCSVCGCCGIFVCLLVVCLFVLFVLFYLFIYLNSYNRVRKQGFDLFLHL